MPRPYASKAAKPRDQQGKMAGRQGFKGGDRGGFGGGGFGGRGRGGFGGGRGGFGDRGGCKIIGKLTINFSQRRQRSSKRRKFQRKRWLLISKP